LGKAKGKDKEMKTFFDLRNKLDEGKYVGGPQHTWPQHIGANNSPQANKIKKALTKAGHSFDDHGHLPANKKANKHFISMKDKEGHSALTKLKKTHMKNEDSDAVKAFLAKGGKIKKLPPGKAAGYHGKDDPGKGMHGMMDKPDTKGFKKNKFVGSMK
jgi:hypothetical protein